MKGIEIMVPEFKFLLDDGLEDSFLPTRAHDTDTGWDVSCASKRDCWVDDGRTVYGIRIAVWEYVRIPLGLKVFSPHGYWLDLRPRSSTHAKKNLHSLYGVIDQSYEGALQFSCQYIPDINKRIQMSEKDGLGSYPGDKAVLAIEFGERIGQLVPVKKLDMTVTKVDKLEFERLCVGRGDERGAGGYGSTG